MQATIMANVIDIVSDHLQLYSFILKLICWMTHNVDDGYLVEREEALH
jgi:hypothetical protein